MDPIYLDYNNATMAITPEVAKAMVAYLHEYAGNPPSKRPRAALILQGVADASAAVQAGSQQAARILVKP